VGRGTPACWSAGSRWRSYRIASGPGTRLPRSLVGPLASPRCAAQQLAGRRWRPEACAALVSGNAEPWHHWDQLGAGAFATCAPRSMTCRVHQPDLDASTLGEAEPATVTPPVSRSNLRAACMGNSPFNQGSDGLLFAPILPHWTSLAPSTTRLLAVLRCGVENRVMMSVIHTRQSHLQRCGEIL
jgi:hypothetical protein